MIVEYGVSPVTFLSKPSRVEAKEMKQLIDRTTGVGIVQLLCIMLITRNKVHSTVYQTEIVK